MEQRNIVLITWDSVRADHCSCYGYSKETTPFLDSLARRGLKFENAIVSGLPTPISMGGIFTTRYQLQEKIRGKTLAEIFSKKGYITAAFHSNPFASRYYAFNRGFQIFNDYIIKSGDKEFDRSSNKLRKILSKLIIKSKIVNIERVRFYYNLLNVAIRGKYDVGLRFEDFYNNIIQFIDSCDKNYFIWILLIDTHFPYVPKDMHRIEKLKSMILYDKFYSQGITRSKSNMVDTKKLKLIIKSYDKCIRYADQMTKKLWKDIKDTDPILVIHADHGDAFGEHGFFGHPPEHYEYLIRVPLVIYNVDISEKIEQPVSLLNFSPTICKFAGIGNEFIKDDLLNSKLKYTVTVNKLKEGLRVTVRGREWKLIINPDRENELYNIKKDSNESLNLLNDEKDIAEKLKTIAKQEIKKISECERIDNIKYKIKNKLGEVL